MALDDDLTKLQTILGDVATPTGERAIQRVFKNPRSQTVTTAELPCILLFCRKPSSIEGFTFGVEKRVSEVVVQFIYCPDGQGNLEDSYFSTLAYSENILDVLYLHHRLADSNGVDQVNWALPKSAGVPGTLKEKWGGMSFFGAEILVQVVASRDITFGD